MAGPVKHVPKKWSHLIGQTESGCGGGIDEDMEATREEIIQIVTTFLLSSPPGEFMEVVTDVRGLLSDEGVLNETAPATFREYNTDQMLPVDSPGQKHKALITKYGEVNEGEYLDPRGNQVVQFDHIRQEVTGSRPISGELDATMEPYRQAIDGACAQYTLDHYKEGASAVYSSPEGTTMCISASKFNPKNFWNGRWRSVWSAKFSPNGPVTLEGDIRINVHYYEDGNVQLVTNYHVQRSCNGGDPSKTAQDVFKVIKKDETSFHTELMKMYNTMGETTFKALRRALPITRQKIDWEKINNFRIGGMAGGR